MFTENLDSPSWSLIQLVLGVIGRVDGILSFFLCMICTKPHTLNWDPFMFIDNKVVTVIHDRNTKVQNFI